MKKERMIELLAEIEKVESRGKWLQRFIKEIDQQDYPEGGKKTLVLLAEQEMTGLSIKIKELENIQK